MDNAQLQSSSSLNSALNPHLICSQHQLSKSSVPPTSFHFWGALPTELQREILKHCFKSRSIASIEDFKYYYRTVLASYYRTRNRKFCAIAREVFYGLNTFRLSPPVTRDELYYYYWPPGSICRSIRKLQVRVWIDISCSKLDDVFSDRWPFTACTAKLLVPRNASITARNCLWMNKWQEGLQNLTHLKLDILPTPLEHHLRVFDSSKAILEDMVSLENFERMTHDTEIKLRAHQVEVEIAAECPYDHEECACPVEARLAAIIRRLVKQPDEVA